MRVTIKLHGSLKKVYEGLFSCEANTAAEALNMLFTQHRHIRPPGGGRWVTQVAGMPAAESLYLPLETDHLDVFPAFMGSGGNNGFFQIIIGITLIVAAVILAGPVGLGWSSSWVVGLALSGAVMALGGVISMLTPAPRLDRPEVKAADNKTPEESRYLGAAGNTTASGTRIILGYGRYRIAGHILSFDVEGDIEPIGGQAPASDDRTLVSNTVKALSGG